MQGFCFADLGWFSPAILGVNSMPPPQLGLCALHFILPLAVFSILRWDLWTVVSVVAMLVVVSVTVFFSSHCDTNITTV